MWVLKVGAESNAAERGQGEAQPRGLSCLVAAGTEGLGHGFVGLHGHSALSPVGHP